MRASPARLAGLLVAIFVLLAGSAMLHTSTTYDEIVFPAVGARGMATGDFMMVNDHPRLAQYVYGLPLIAAGVKLPPEDVVRWSWSTRYQYAKTVYWASGNSGDQVAILSRLVGLAFGALTVLATFLLARHHMPPGAALFAAALVAFTPDMLAHSGVSYNDVPVTFAILVGAYALDAMVRRPGARNGAIAGVAFSLAALLKYSGLILLPILAVLLALETWTRWRDATWRTGIVRAAGAMVAVVYLAIALAYGGDWHLGTYFAGIAELSRPTLTEGMDAFLLGERREGGWWYFFPVAFLLKTSVGLHVLALSALAAGAAGASGGAWRAWVRHPARAPAVGVALLLAAMLAARMNIGTRHALPAVPFACILIAQGVAWWWARGPRAGRVAVALAFVAVVASPLRHYPFFLSYLSEYALGRPSYEVLVDSNTDWGQGLVALRQYMRDNGLEEVALGYFGTAVPWGYGIRYARLPSFVTLLYGGVPDDSRPRYAVVSATLLAGMYVKGDPYRSMRQEKPVAILGGSLYVFDTRASRKP